LSKISLKNYTSGGKHNRASLLSPFHLYNEKVELSEGLGSYALFHADLGVADNENSCMQMVDNVCAQVQYPFIVAGKRPSAHLKKKLQGYSNIQLMSDVSAEKMDRLISDAQFIIMHSSNPSGFKIKLLHALCRGRFCLANKSMLSGSGLDSFFHVYDHWEEIVNFIRTNKSKVFDLQSVKERNMALFPRYSNLENGRKILELIN
jgi:hypothetical protein